MSKNAPYHKLSAGFHQRFVPLFWLVFLLLAILLWQFFAAQLGYFLSTPLKITQALVQHRDALLYNAAITLFELSAGLVLGVVLGAGIGIAMAYQPLFERLGTPFLISSQAIPVFAIAPLLVFWFGFGLAPRIIMACLIVFFPMAMGMLQGVKQAKKKMQALIAPYDPRPLSVFLHLYLPHSVPQFTQALRVCVASAPIAVLVGEWIGGASGIGWLMLHARARFDMALMMAALLVIFALALLLYSINQKFCRWLEQRYL